MLLMRGFWQLADMHQRFLHVPIVKEVWDGTCAGSYLPCGSLWRAGDAHTRALQK